MLRGELEVFVDLQTQFTSRNNDQSRYAGFWFCSGALQNREAEAECFSGACLRLTNNVLARDCERNGLLLDRKCVDDSVFSERVNDVLVNAKFRKSSQNCLSFEMGLRHFSRVQA